MSNEFTELNKRIARLRRIHQQAFCSFNVYEQLNKLRAPNIVGEAEADQNAQIMSAYTGFFTSAESALNLEFLMLTAKLFDTHKDALHLNRLINFAEQNQRHLTAADFKEFNEGRQYLDELVAKYEGIERKDLLDMGKRLQEVEPILQKLKDHRDKILAHEDMRRDGLEKITYEEISKLLDLSHDILNIFSSRTNHETTSYLMLKRQSVEDTKQVISALRELEQGE